MKKFLSLFILLLAGLTTTIDAQSLLSELNGNSVVNFSSSCIKESFKTDQWYVMYNAGRKAYAYGSGSMTSTKPFSGGTLNESYNYMVRFLPAGSTGKYYIQTPEGKYYCDLAYNSNAGVTSDESSAGLFTIGEITEGSFYLMGSKYAMDSNGNVIVGWSTTTPDNPSGNSAWEFSEVTITDPGDLTGGALVSYQLAQGGLLRIQSRGNATQYITEATEKGTTKSKITTASTRMTQMWIVEHAADGFSLRNAATGNYLQKDYSCSTSKFYWKIQLSPNNTSDSQKYIIICNTTPESTKKTCINLNGGSSGLTKWYYDNDKNSEWLIEPVASSEVDTASVKANLDKICNVGSIDTTVTKYYTFTNLDNGQLLTVNRKDDYLITMDKDDSNYNQYFEVAINEDGTYRVISIWNSKHMKRKATQATSACTGTYMTSNTGSVSARNWNINVGTYAWETTYSFVEPNKPETAVGLSGTNTANKSVSATSAQWIITPATLTDDQIAEATEDYEQFKLLNNTILSTLNKSVMAFFDDYACTKLKDDYMAVTDDSLSTAMSNAGIPAMIIKMALKVKNDTWGPREKEFRVYDYKPYSDPTQWNATARMGTGYQFSPQTGPTGISVKQGDVVILYVDNDPITGTTLKFSNNSRYTVNAATTNLVKGINIYVAPSEGHLFIQHTITNVSKKLAEVDPITIHIEGGRVNGYFDITRGHNNEDWKDLVANFFQDEIVHMKSQYYEYNMLLSGVKAQITTAELDEVDTDGTEKGITGTLTRWDQLVATQRYLMNVDRFKEYFNCLLSASSSSDGNPYASSYGTYYPGVGTIMNYKALNRGTENDEGGNYWCIAHETGHIHQGLINMAGCTEISNNFFSQVCTWMQGSNTGRGRPWSNSASSFHSKVFWQEYDLWQRSRAYFQLWLYFHLMGHDTEFYPKLFDKMRQNPMTRSTSESNPGSGTTDYLRFAEYCCEIAQADLSEFFDFYGFFIPLKNYTVGDYSNSYFTTTQAEIDASLARMHKYSKKLGNILFIDERIEKYPADYPGMPSGAMRVATSSDATPGDATEVGELGMFTNFVDNPEYRQYSCVYRAKDKSLVISKSSGTGAVGFKVYNADHQLVRCSNTYTFALPEDLANSTYYVMAALGDGTDRLIYDPKDISAVSSIEDAQTAFDPQAPCYSLDGQLVKSPQVGTIYIQNGRKFKYTK